MRQLFKLISRTERTAARCDERAGRCFSQASISSYFQAELIEAGFAYQLEGHQQRLRAAKLLRSVPAVVIGQ